jgi:cytochrome c biogenesis protein
MGIKILKFFSSIKLAVALILMLSATTLIGVFFPWIPAHSIFFFVVVILLMMSIAICTIRRRKTVSSASKKAKASSEEDFYLKSPYHIRAESKESIEKVEQLMNRLVKTFHYTPAETVRGDGISTAGDKYRHSAYGTYAVHLSLLLFFLAILLGSIFGFKNDSLIICENTDKNVGHNTNLSIYLESFDDKYWEDGTPRDYRSDVVLLKNGKEVEKYAIRVNHPMSYQGIRFHQSSFGPAVKIKITDSDGAEILYETIPLTMVQTDYSIQRPVGTAMTKNGEFHVEIVGSALNGEDNSIGQDEIGIELYDPNMSPVAWAIAGKNVPTKLDKVEITFLGVSQYTELLVSKDTGILLIWIASFLFITGLFVIFFFPHRQIWISLRPTANNGTSLMIRLSSGKDIGLEDEFEKIVAAYEKETKEKVMTD